MYSNYPNINLVLYTKFRYCEAGASVLCQPRQSILFKNWIATRSKKRFARDDDVGAGSPLSANDAAYDDDGSDKSALRINVQRSNITKDEGFKYE